MTGRRVVIIEDNEALGNLTQFTLELEGYQVEWFASGREGLAAVQAQPPDLLLLDLAMPRFSGWDVLECLKDQIARRDFVVAIITASADPEIKEQARALGVARVLVKPISAGELVQVVKEMIGEPCAKTP